MNNECLLCCPCTSYVQKSAFCSLKLEKVNAEAESVWEKKFENPEEKERINK